MSNTSSITSEATFSTLSTTSTAAALDEPKQGPANFSNLYSSFLNCQLCSRPYTQPKLLPCLHTFCQACLTEYVPFQSLSLVCPTCSRHAILPIGGILSLQNNVFVTQLLHLLQKKEEESEDLNLASNCGNRIECSNEDVFLNNLSNGDGSSHTPESQPSRNTYFEETTSPSDDHSKRPSTPSSSSPAWPVLKCLQHTNNNLNLYCNNCEAFVCVTCAQNEHTQHNLQALKDVNQTEKISLRMTLEKVRHHMTPLEISLKNISKTIEKLERQENESREKLEKSFEAIAEALERRKNDLLEDLKEKSDNKKKVLTKQRDELTKVKYTYEVSCDFIEGKINEKFSNDCLENGECSSKEIDVVNNQDERKDDSIERVNDDNEHINQRIDDDSALLILAKKELHSHFEFLFQTPFKFPPHENPFVLFDDGVINKLTNHLHSSIGEASIKTTENDAGNETANGNRNTHVDTNNSQKNSLNSTHVTKPSSPIIQKNKKPSVNFDPLTTGKHELDATRVMLDGLEKSLSDAREKDVLLRKSEQIGEVLSTAAVPHKTEAQSIRRCYLNTPTKIMVCTKDFLDHPANNNGAKLTAKIFNLTSFKSRSRESSTSRCASVSDKMSVDSNDNAVNNENDNNDGNSNNDTTDHSHTTDFNSIDDDSSLTRSASNALTSKNINSYSENMIRKKVILVPKIVKVDEFNYEVCFTITDDVLATIKKYDDRLKLLMGKEVDVSGAATATPHTATPHTTTPRSTTPHTAPPRTTPSQQLFKSKTSPHSTPEKTLYNKNNFKNDNKNNSNSSSSTNTTKSTTTSGRRNDGNRSATPTLKSSSAKLLKRPMSAQLHRTTSLTPSSPSPSTSAATIATVQLEICLFKQPIRKSPFILSIKPHVTRPKPSSALKNHANGIVRGNMRNNVTYNNNNNNKAVNNNNNSINNKNNSLNNNLAFQASFTSVAFSDSRLANHEEEPNDDQLGGVKIGSRGHEKGQFMNLQGIAVHGDLVAAADSNAQRIQLFTLGGKFLFRFGVRGRGQGQLTRPTGVAFSRDGKLLAVSDYENKCVNLYDSANGKFVSKLGHGKLIGPKGVMVDACDRLVVVDNKASVIWLFSLAGKLLGKFGKKVIVVPSDESSSVKTKASSPMSPVSDSSLRLAGPQFCGMDPCNGDVVVTDFHNHSVKIFDKIGTYIDTVDTSSCPLYGPQGLALTNDHTEVIVADSGNHCLKLFKHPLIE